MRQIIIDDPKQLITNYFATEEGQALMKAAFARPERSTYQKRLVLNQRQHDLLVGILKKARVEHPDVVARMEFESILDQLSKA